MVFGLELFVVFVLVVQSPFRGISGFEIQVMNAHNLLRLSLRIYGVSFGNRFIVRWRYKSPSRRNFWPALSILTRPV